METAKLENWYIRENKLHGKVFGHVTLEDGEVIATSLIASINYDLKEVTTANTRYLLGEVNPRYYMLASSVYEVADVEKLFGKRAWQGCH